MSLPGFSLSEIRAAVEEAESCMKKGIYGSPELPEEQEKFKEILEQIEQEATLLEQNFKMHNPPLSDAKGIKTTLVKFQELLQQYRHQLGESVQAQQRSNATGLSAAELAKLKSLRREMKHGWVRVTFTSQLLTRVPHALLGHGEAAEPSEGTHRTDFKIEVVPSGIQSIGSAKNWLEQQAQTTSTYPKDISGIFNSSLADLWMFNEPVELTLPRNKFKLSKLKVLTRDDESRTLLWLNDAESIMLEHQMKRGTVPYTDPIDPNFEVSFPVESLHRFIRTDLNGIHPSRIRQPKYEFKSEPERVKFQEFVRERQLLGTFEAFKIETTTGSFPRILTSGQYIKVWMLDDASKHLTFTVWITEKNRTGQMGHVEYSAQSFNLDIKQPGDKKAVRLRVKKTAADQHINFQSMVIYLESAADRNPFLESLALERLVTDGSQTNSIATTPNTTPRSPEMNFFFGWDVNTRFPGSVNAGNWKQLLSHLPPYIKDDIKYSGPLEGTKGPGTWTLYPSDSQIEFQTPVPLQIKGAPVIIPASALNPLETGNVPPSDPCLETIDPSSDLEEHVSKIFQTYDDAIGFYALLSGDLQIIVPPEFDAALAYSRNPNYFGGLKVSYVPICLSLTSKRSRLANIFRRNEQSTDSSTTATTVPTPGPSEASSSTIALPSSIQTTALKTNDDVEARTLRPSFSMKRGEDSTYPYLGKIAVRTRLDNTEYLTISTHVLNNAFTMRAPFIPWNSRPVAPSVQDLKTKLSIFVDKQLIGNVSEIFDPDPANYPKGYKHDISLIKPTDDVDTQNVKSPIANLQWISKQERKDLKKGESAMELLGYPSQEGKSIRNYDDRSCLIVGEGYFKSSTPQTMTGLNKQISEADRVESSHFISRCLLFRIKDDWREPSGYSGVALVAKIQPPGEPEKAVIAGFQSFVQRAHAVQNYDHDQETLDQRMRMGQVCFYGAFDIPDELRRHEIL